jgi:methylase of polypeptide subunit release factors
MLKSSEPQNPYCRRVLEVGCGGIALPSILSAAETAGIVATDGDAAAMHLLDANVRLNSDAFELSKLRAERLRCVFLWSFEVLTFGPTLVL